MIFIDTNSTVTINDQIVTKVSHLILSGALHNNEKLPSVRKLAQMLVINPSTVQKAYLELEEKGFIYCEKNVGYFVNKNNESLKSEEIKKLFNSLDTIFNSLIAIGVTKDEILEKLNKQGGK